MTTQYTKGDKNLLELAGICETAKSYNQGTLTHLCGTPACAMGHWQHAHPRRTRGLSFFEIGAHDFEIDDAVEYIRVFGGNGCDCAKRSGKKAGAYIRNFVAQRVAARGFAHSFDIAAAKALQEKEKAKRFEQMMVLAFPPVKR